MKKKAARNAIGMAIRMRIKNQITDHSQPRAIAIRVLLLRVVSEGENVIWCVLDKTGLWDKRFDNNVECAKWILSKFLHYQHCII